MILHVQCRNIDSAKILLEISINCGFRESGIVPCITYYYFLVNKTMVGIRTTSNSLEIPIFSHKKMLVTDEYIKYLVDYSNDLYNKNIERLNSLQTKIINYFNHSKIEKCIIKTSIEKINVNYNDNYSNTFLSYMDNLNLNIERYGHTITKINNNKLIIFGGYGRYDSKQPMSRLNDLIEITIDSNYISKVIEVNCDIPTPRLYHSTILYKNNYLITFGGRTNPNEPLKDVLIFDFLLNKWFIYDNLKGPENRWSCSLLECDNDIILYGGRNNEKVFNDIWLLMLNVNNEYTDNNRFSLEWKNLIDSSRKCITPRFSHAGIYIGDNNVLYIGGLSNLIYPLNKAPPLMIYNYKTNNVKISSVNNNSSLAIYKHKIIKITNENYIIIGGTTYNNTIGCWIYNIVNNTVNKIKISNEYFKEYRPSCDISIV